VKDSSKVLVSVAVGIGFVVALFVPAALSGYPGIPSGQYSPYGGTMAAQGQSIQMSQAVQMMRGVPPDAHVIPSNNTIVFGGSSVKLVVLATDLEGAANLTSNAPPGYASDNVFVIYGLINPTLVVSRGATLQMAFVNLDGGDYHNFAISTTPPPYPYMAMQGMMNWQQQGIVQMMPFLPPASYAQGVAHEYPYSVTLSTQTSLWYLCTYPGHAQMGMYGEVLVN